jgi:hypothetical protein
MQIECILSLVIAMMVKEQHQVFGPRTKEARYNKSLGPRTTMETHTAQPIAMPAHPIDSYTWYYNETDWKTRQMTHLIFVFIP